MTDAELETLLRGTLATRAASVSPPTWEVPARSRPWLRIAAAAAVVAGVGVAAAAIPHGGHDRPPATTTTVGTPPDTSEPPSPTPKPSARAACTTTLPPAWRSALAHSALDVGGSTVTPLSVTPDGDVLAARDFGPVPGSRRDLVLVAPGGAPRVVYTVPDPDDEAVQSAQQDGHQVVVAVHAARRAGRGVVSNSGSTGQVRRVVVVDLRTERSRTIATSSGTIQQAFALDGAAYWDDGRAIERYDLSRGTTTVAYRGEVSFPAASAGGTGWPTATGFDLVVPAALPGVVAGATNAVQRSTLATDGTSWAWVAGARRLGWWTTGAARPTYVDVRDEVGTQPGSYPTPLTVSGAFVFTPATVVDVRTAAGAGLPSRVGPLRGRGEFAMFSGPGGAVAGYGETSTSGRYVDGYWLDAATIVTRFSTKRLPGLSC